MQKMHILSPEAFKQLQFVREMEQLEHLQDKQQQELKGGLLQYAHEPTDIDESILALRERDPLDFLEPLLNILGDNPSMELAICIVYIYQLLYPDNITKDQTKEYELKHAKEFVPDRFIQDIPFYSNSFGMLIEGLKAVYPEHQAILKEKILDIQLEDLSTTLFTDEKRIKAAEILLEYSYSRHLQIQDLVRQSDITQKTPGLIFIAYHNSKIQTEEILNLYFEQLLGTEVIRSFYQNHKIDLYADDYQQITLPVEDDAFLKELDIFINQEEEPEEYKENFLDMEPDLMIEIDMDDQYKKQLPIELQQKILQHEFNQRTLISNSLIPYCMLIGHQNSILLTNEIPIEIKSRQAPLPYEPVQPNELNATIGQQREFFKQIIKGMTRGFNGHAQQI